MQTPDLINRVCTYSDRQCPTEDTCPTDLPGLMILCSRRSTSLQTILYKPLLCLILQGRKGA